MSGCNNAINQRSNTFISQIDKPRCKLRLLFDLVKSLFVICIMIAAQSCAHSDGSINNAKAKRTNIVLIGPPGSGKGTQAKHIEKYFHIPHISTGDLLRKEITANSAMAIKLKKILDAGQLVPDDIMLEILQKRIAEPDCQNGFILDGFPRTIAQAKALKKLDIDIDYVIEIKLKNDVIIKRIGGRYIHKPSGRVYHIEANPPKVLGKDDTTGEDLIQRDDDKPEIIKKRLKLYTEETAPLIQYYQTFDTENGKFHQPHYIEIDGNQDIYGITEDIINKIIKTQSTIPPR